MADIVFIFADSGESRGIVIWMLSLFVFPRSRSKCDMDDSDIYYFRILATETLTIVLMWLSISGTAATFEVSGSTHLLACLPACLRAIAILKILKILKILEILEICKTIEILKILKDPQDP